MQAKSSEILELSSFECLYSNTQFNHDNSHNFQSSNKRLKSFIFYFFFRFRLKDLLRLRLTECGWNDEVRLLCRDVIKEDAGNVNVEKIVKQVTPKARSLVPDTVKRELLQKIKTILSTQGGVDM